MDVTTTVSSVKRTLRTGERLVKRTSEPVWRYGFNAGPTRDYRRRPPVLGDEAQRVLATVNRDGLATSNLADLTGDPTLLERLQEEAYRLEGMRAEELEGRRERIAAGNIGGPKDKEFVMELLDSRRPVIEPNGLLARTALNEQLRGVADGYYGLRTRVSDINFWRNLPTPLPPRSSQLWHRDLPEDYYILKLFVYLEDCGDTNGPFTYLVGHPRQGRPAVPAAGPGRRPDQAQQRRRAREAGVLDRMRRCTGKAGDRRLRRHRGLSQGWLGPGEGTPALPRPLLLARRAPEPDARGALRRATAEVVARPGFRPQERGPPGDDRACTRRLSSRDCPDTLETPSPSLAGAFRCVRGGYTPSSEAIHASS